MPAARRFRHALALLTALLLLASALIAHGLGWIGVVTQAATTPQLSAPIPPGGLRVAILKSEATRSFLGASADYDQHVAYWTLVARRLGAAVDVVTDAALERDLKPAGVLILPSAVCLGPKAQAGIRSFLAAGGGVVATWATGSRDESGSWQGWAFLRSLTGADGFDVRETAAPWFVSFRGGNPVAAGRAAGTRVQVASPERLEATALEVDGYWSDERLWPRDPRLPGSFQGAVLHRLAGAGRVVWLGFQENSAVAGGPDAELLDSVLTNAVAWAGGAPRADLEPWPWPHPAAALLALEVAASPENVAYAVEALSKAGARGTFFYAPARIEDARDVPGLARAGEIGWKAPDLAASSPIVRVRQLVRIAAARFRLRQGGVWPTGLFRAAGVPASLGPLAGAGFRYAVVGEAGGSVRPGAVAVTSALAGLRRERDFALLAATTDDDLHLSPLGLLGLEDDWIARRVLADFEIVRGLGGLYVLRYHSQGLSAPEYAPVLRRLIDDWRGGGAWVATGGEIAEWWLARSRLAVTVSGQDERLLHVEVEASAPVPRGVTVSLFPATGFSGAHVEMPKGEGSAPQIVADPPSGRIRLVLGPLAPHDSRRYDVRLER